MSGSTLTAFNYIPELSEATPGLWNSVFSVLSQNIAEANSIGTIVSNISTVGMVTINANSNVTNYLYFNDTSNQRSDYIIGSQVGGTADGLNIYDVSGQTMVVSFSKQSVRFYSPTVGVAFDVGGADFNVRAFGAVGDGVADDTNAFVASIGAVPATGGVVFMPGGIYKITDTINLSYASTAKQAITLRGAGIGATRIVSTVTNKPGIISNDSSVQGNGTVLEEFDLYQSGNVLPSFSSGNFGIRNIGTNYPYLALRRIRVRYWGDIGVRLEGGNGPFALQDVEVQSCASWGIHLVPLGASVPEEVQIIGGNIHTCAGGLRCTGTISTGVYDTDIELGTVALFPSVQCDGGGLGGHFVDVSTSIQTVPSPAAVIYLSNTVGTVFTGGQCVTSGASVDNIQIDSTAARLNSFIGGYYSSSSGGWYANIINGAKQNTFRAPTLGPYTAGFGKVNNSTSSGDEIQFVGSSAISDDRSLVLGGTLSIGTGAAVFPSINWAGSEASLGFYRSAASTIAQSYGTLIVSGLDTTAGNLSSGSITNAASITMTRSGTGALYFNMASGNQAYLLANNTTLDTRVASTQARWLNNAGTVAIMTLSNGGQLSVSSDIVSSNGTVRGVALWGTSGLSVGGTLIPAISSMSSLVGAFIVQGSASSFTGITWAAAKIGDHIITSPFQGGAASSLSSGLVAHSIVTVNGQIEFRLSNVSTLVQNQSSQTWIFTRISAF